MIRALALFLTVTAAGSAQLIGLGVKVGTSLNDVDVALDPQHAWQSDTPFIFGPQFELRLPAGFAIELDALYTNLKLKPASIAATVTGLNTFDTDSWEFPIMLKKKFGKGALKPFILTGASFRRLTDIRNVGSFITGNTRERNTSDLDGRSSTGFVLGGGLEVKLLFLRISPEIRWTRWGTESFTQGLHDVFQLNRNQAQVLVGFGF